MLNQRTHRVATAVLATAIGSVFAAAVVHVASVVLPRFNVADLFDSDGFADFVVVAIISIVYVLLLATALLVAMFVLPAAMVTIALRMVGADRIAWTVAGGLALWYGMGLILRARTVDVEELMLLPFAFVAARVAVDARWRGSPRRESNP
jgi:hypothetical protein